MVSCFLFFFLLPSFVARLCFCCWLLGFLTSSFSLPGPSNWKKTNTRWNTEEQRLNLWVLFLQLSSKPQNHRSSVVCVSRFPLKVMYFLQFLLVAGG